MVDQHLIVCIKFQVMWRIMSMPQSTKLLLLWHKYLYFNLILSNSHPLSSFFFFLFLIFINKPWIGKPFNLFFFLMKTMFLVVCVCMYIHIHTYIYRTCLLLFCFNLMYYICIYFYNVTTLVLSCIFKIFVISQPKHQ